MCSLSSAAASTSAESQAPARHDWGNVTSLSSTLQQANCQFSFRMLCLEVEKWRLLVLLGEWMCLQPRVYFNISGNPVQLVVYNCRDRLSHSTSRCLLNVCFATGRVGAGVGGWFAAHTPGPQRGLADLHHCYWQYANMRSKILHLLYETIGQETP